MAGMFYGKQFERTAEIRRSEQAASDKLSEKLDSEISSFNSLAQKHGHSMRLWYQPDQEMAPGRLVIGTKDQFEYNNYQAVLAYGLNDALTVAQSFRIFHCAEFGE